MLILDGDAFIATCDGARHTVKHRASQAIAVIDAVTFTELQTEARLSFDQICADILLDAGVLIYSEYLGGYATPSDHAAALQHGEEEATHRAQLSRDYLRDQI